MKNSIVKLMIVVTIIMTMMMSTVAMAAEGLVNVYEETPDIKGLYENPNATEKKEWTDLDLSDRTPNTTSDAALVLDFKNHNTAKQAMVITGYLIPKEDKTGFKFIHDDGIKVMINHLDGSNYVTKTKWALTSETTMTFSENLEVNKVYPFRIEYFDWGGTEVLKTDLPMNWFHSTIPSYTVTYMDGSEVIKNETGDHGFEASGQAMSDKDGFVFGGWTLEGDPYNFNAPVVSNLTLEAVWTPIPQYDLSLGATIYEMAQGATSVSGSDINPAAGTVKFYANNLSDATYLGSSNGTFIDPKPSLEAGETLVMEAVANPGYTFVTWKYNLENPTNTPRPNPREDFVVSPTNTEAIPTPVFTRNTYSVTASSNVPGIVNFKQTGDDFHYGDPYDVSFDYTDDHHVTYIFDGWYLPGTETQVSPSGTITEDVSLEARFTKANIWVAVDDAAPEVYVNGQAVLFDPTIHVPLSGVNHWSMVAKEHVVGLTNDAFVAAIGQDLYKVISGFNLVLEQPDGSFVETNGSVVGQEWYYYVAGLDAPPADFDDYQWYEEDYVAEGWQVVSEVTPHSNWVKDTEFPSGTDHNTWIWSNLYSGNSLDQVVYLRSSIPRAPYTVTLSTMGDDDQAVGLVKVNGQESVTVGHGDQVALTAPTLTNYDFLGWFDGDQKISDPSAFKVNEDKALVAKYTLATYTIETQASPSIGGTTEGGGNFDYGHLATLTAQEAQGYDFSHWRQEGNPAFSATTSDISVKVEEDASYVAHFVPEVYEVKVTASPSKGGSVTGGGSYDYKSEVTLTATAKTGYDFIGWAEGDQEPSEFNLSKTITVTEDASYTAYFEKQTYTVAVSATTGGSASILDADSLSVTMPYGTTVTGLASAPDRGYQFVAWVKDWNGKVKSTDLTFETKAKFDKSFTAVYEALDKYYVAVEISEEDSAHVSATPDLATYFEGEDAGVEVTLEDDQTSLVTMKLYSEGPEVDGVKARTFIKDLTDLSIELKDLKENYVVVIDTMTTYEVTFDGAGAETATPEVQSIEEGAFALEPSVPTKNNDVFLGWFEDLGQGLLADQAFDFETMAIEDDTALVAKWLQVPDTVDVSFDAVNDTEIRVETIVYNTQVAVPEKPVRDKDTFLGWFEELGPDELAESAFDFSQTINENTTLRAKWQTYVPNTYVAVFNTDGGSPTPEAETVTEGGSVSKPLTDPTKTNWTFVGWFEDRGDDGLAEAAYDFSTILEDNVALIALWQAVPTVSTRTRTVTYDLSVTIEGQGSVTGAGTYNSGTRVTLVATPAEGYIFDSWEGVGDDGTVIMSGDQSVRAVFVEAIVEEELGEAVETELPEAPGLDILDGMTPEAAGQDKEDEALPQTGGLPYGPFAALGLFLTGFGYKLRKKY